MQNLALAVSRIFLGILFFVYGFSKLFLDDAFGGGHFVGDYFPAYVAKALGEAGHPYFFWRPFLEHVVQPYASVFGWLVAAGEFLLGISLVAGYKVRWTSMCGIVLLASIHCNANPFAEPGPFWTQLHSFSIQALPALLLAIFLFSGAGKTLGLDGMRKKKKRPARKDEEED